MRKVLPKIDNTKHSPEKNIFERFSSGIEINEGNKEIIFTFESEELKKN